MPGMYNIMIPALCEIFCTCYNVAIAWDFEVTTDGGGSGGEYADGNDCNNNKTSNWFRSYNGLLWRPVCWPVD